MGLEDSIRQTFGELVVHTPHTTSRMRLPWTFSTFDYRELCGLLWEQCDARVRDGKGGGPPDPTETTTSCVTDRGEVSAPLVVDALGWRRVLAADGGYQPPDAPLSRGLEVHPWGARDDLEIWIDRRYVPAGYGWSFPAGDEMRVGVGSFDPRSTSRSRPCCSPTTSSATPVRYQGNWIPHRLRPGAEDRRLLLRRLGGPLPAADRRGHPHRVLLRDRAAARELRGVVEGRATREHALRDYAAFTARHEWKFKWMLRAQRAVPRVPPRLLAAALALAAGARRFVDWSFSHYLRIAHPSFAAGERGAPATARRRSRPRPSGRSGTSRRAAARRPAPAPR